MRYRRNQFFCSTVSIDLMTEERNSFDENHESRVYFYIGHTRATFLLPSYHVSEYFRLTNLLRSNLSLGIKGDAGYVQNAMYVTPEDSIGPKHRPIRPRRGH